MLSVVPIQFGIDLNHNLFQLFPLWSLLNFELESQFHQLLSRLFPDIALLFVELKLIVTVAQILRVITTRLFFMYMFLGISLFNYFKTFIIFRCILSTSKCSCLSLLSTSIFFISNLNWNTMCDVTTSWNITL